MAKLKHKRPNKKKSSASRASYPTPTTSKSKARGALSTQNPWKTASIRLVYQNPWIQVREAQVTTPAQTPGIYGVVHFKNLAVGVVAIDPHDRILMVGQYRYPLREYSWELPEGGCPLGTSGLQTAKRELKEETGYRAAKWIKLLELTLSNSSTDERAVIYEAFDLTAGKSAPEETESLEVRWMSFREVVKKIKRGEIRDAITVAGVLHVALRRCVESKR